MSRAQGARAQTLLAFESTYGTPPATGYWRMPFASNSLGSGQPLLESELLGYGRDPIDPTLDVITVDGGMTVPIDLQSWGVWLKAAFGAPSTVNASGVYTHEFTSGNWVLPSMSIEKGMPDVPQFSMCSGVMVNTISWTMQRGGLLTANVTLNAQGEEDDTTSQDASPTDWVITRLGQFNGSVKHNASQMADVMSAQVNYNNNLDLIDTIRDDGKIDGIDPSMASLSGSVTLRFSSTALLDQATSGVPCALEFGFTRSATEKFVLNVPRVFLPRPKVSIEGPAGVQATFDWQAAKDGNNPMCTATLVNDVAAY
jgi:tail tube protein